MRTIISFKGSGSLLIQAIKEFGKDNFELGYLVFCENHSPWNEDEHNMIRVHSNAESHKLLNILESKFGIPNNHKG
jgi:hypothetical protein